MSVYYFDFSEFFPYILLLSCMLVALYLYRVAHLRRLNFYPEFQEQIVLSRIIAFCAIISACYNVLMPETAQQISIGLIIIVCLAIMIDYMVKSVRSEVAFTKKKLAGNFCKFVARRARVMITQGKTQEALELLIRHSNGNLQDIWLGFLAQYTKNDKDWQIGLISKEEHSQKGHELNYKIFKVLRTHCSSDYIPT